MTVQLVCKQTQVHYLCTATKTQNYLKRAKFLDILNKKINDPSIYELWFRGRRVKETAIRQGERERERGVQHMMMVVFGDNLEIQRIFHIFVNR